MFNATNFSLKRLAQKYNLDNDREKLTYISEAVKQISLVRNPVEQDMYIERLAKSAQVSIDALKANLARERRKNNRVQSRTRQYKNYPNRSYNTVDTLIPPEQPIDYLLTNRSRKTPSQTRLLYLFIHSTEAQKYLLNGNFHFPDKEFEKIGGIMG